MTERFFRHYLDFFLGFIIIMLGSLAAVECITLFFIVHNGWFLTGFSTSFSVTLLYCLNFLLKFREFKADLDAYFPKITEKDEFNINIIKEVDKIIEKDEKSPINACRIFCQSSTSNYGAIQRQFGLYSSETAKRLLRKGIKELLKSYGDKNESERN